MKRFFTVTILLSCFTFISAQEIPNAGFENWTGNTPDQWFPNNPPSGPQPVTESSDSHSGSSSAKLEVVLISGFPLPAQLSAGNSGTGFTVSQRYENLSGYFKFTPTNTGFFDVFIQMWNGGIQGNIIGIGNLNTPTAAADWTQFNVPITYSDPATPDWCTIIIQVGNELNSGSFALVDDLSFTSASGVDLISDGTVPDMFDLEQNYPNPFNPTTFIEYSVPEASNVELKVYDILGNEITTLVNDFQSAGVYRADFNASDLASGMYIAQIKAGDFVKSIKMNLLK